MIYDIWYISNVENINYIEETAQEFTRRFGQISQKKMVQDKKGANLGDLVKNPFKRGMPF